MNDNAGKAESDRGREKRERKTLFLLRLDFKGTWYISKILQLSAHCLQAVRKNLHPFERLGHPFGEKIKSFERLGHAFA